MANIRRGRVSSVCLILLVWTSVAAAESPDPDQVIERYLEAIGGRQALEAIQDRTLKGKLSAFGMPGTMELHEKRPNKMHQFIDMGMVQIEVWFDGEKGYRNDPMQGAGPFTDEDTEEAKANYVISPLANYRERGLKARYVETANVGERPAHVVELTDPRGKAVRFYFDSASHEIVKLVAPLPAREGTGEQEIALSDYREVAGVRFPFKLVRTTATMTVEIETESLEVNTNLDDALFRPPGQVSTPAGNTPQP